MDNKWKKLIYLLMALVILIQVFLAPVIAVATTTVNVDHETTETKSSVTETSTDHPTESLDDLSDESEDATESIDSEDLKNSATSTDRVYDTEDSSTEQSVTVSTREANEAKDIREYFITEPKTILTEVGLTYKDKEGNILTPPVTPETDVAVSYKWEIPGDVRKQIQEGDFFEFQLPDELKPTGKMTGELTNGTDTYATYTIDANGKVTFVFTDEIQNQSDIKGGFEFGAHFDKEHIDGPGDIQIDFPIEDELPSIDVQIRPNTEQSIDKDGHFDRTPNPTKVIWNVDINQAMKELEDPKVTEQWPDGTEFSTVTVYELIMDLDGNIQEVGRKLDSSEYEVDSNGNVTIKGKTNQAYRLVYENTLTDAAIPEKGGTINLTNTATLTDNNSEEGLDAEASVTSEFGKPIEKKKGTYDKDKQEFNWTINYNYGEQKIPQGQANLTDTITGDIDYVPESLEVYNITFNDKGKEVKGEKLEAGVDYEVVYNDDGSFRLNFLHDIDSAIKIEYKTAMTGIVEKPTDISNNVVTGGGDSNGDKGTADQQNIVKKISNVDYSNHTLTWKIAINKNNYYMKNLVVSDVFSPTPGLSLAANGTAGYDVVVRDTTNNKLLEKDKDYQLIINEENGVQKGFEIHFIGDYNPTESTLDIEYKTSFDTEYLNKDDPTHDSFTNKAQANWQSKNDDEQGSEDEDEFKPTEEIAMNAQKGGTYNAQTKRITWRMVVNTGHAILIDAGLTDQIKENQDYVADSLKIYEAKIDSDGAATPVGGSVNEEMLSISQPSAANDQTLQIKFPQNVDTAYIIEFETSLQGKYIDWEAEYDNLAICENKGNQRPVTGKVSIKNGGKVVAKTGTQDETDSDFVNWTATINPAQSTLKDVVIKDKPSTNQVLDQDSITLVEMTVDEDGTLTPNEEKKLQLGIDYEVELKTDNETGEQELQIRMLHEIDRAYQLTYRSFISSTATGSQDTVSNKVTVTGKNEQTVQGEDGEDVTVELDTSTGHATGKKGKLQLQKADEADKTLLLAGATFELWDVEHKQVLREGTYDGVTPLTFGNLPAGDYLLVETSAPEGYTIPDDLITGRKVTVNDGGTNDEITELTVYDTKTSVTLQKVDAQGNPIKLSDEIKDGARFKLEQFVAEKWQEQELTPDRTDQEGRLEIRGLVPGHYRLTEIEAPHGYMINTSPIEFDVTKEESGKIPPVELANFINYQGSAQLIKYDQQGNSLDGAIFKVVDADQQTVQTGIRSENGGKVIVEGLEPGTYYFVETDAPDGYIKNTEPIKFVIEDSAKGEPTLVTTNQSDPLKLINYQGKAQIKKTNQQGQSLTGAEFSVYDKKDHLINVDPETGKAVPLTTDKQGIAQIEGLAPGKYYFIETKAPEGYLINTEKHFFEIKDENQGAPTMVTADDLIDYQGAFKLRKVNTSEKGLAGAEFSLYDSDKKDLGLTATSDKEGIIVFEKLAPGTYYFKETKAPKLPDGTDYILFPELVKVEIPETWEGNPEIFDQGNFQNFTGTAEITKAGDYGSSIEGTRFELYTLTNGEEKKIREIEVGEDGKVTLDNLGAGSYVLREIKASPNYIVNSQPIYFTVDSEKEHNYTVDPLTFTNYSATITGKKVSDSGEGLAGAEFQIYAADNNQQPVGDPIMVIDQNNQKTSVLVSNQQGEIFAQGLDMGQYVLVETKAPKGYLLNQQPWPFEVTAQIGKPKEINLGDLVNYRGSGQLIKTNTQGKTLAGATFNLLDETGKVIAKNLQSNDQGIVLAKDLAPGNYNFVETKAPKGYKLSDEKLGFSIPEKATGRPAVVEAGKYVNEAVPAESTKTTKIKKTTNKDSKSFTSFPKTNEVRLPMIMLIGLLLVASAGYFIYKRKN